MKKLVLAIAFAIMFCICAVASEQTIYVSGFGNDENPGTKDEPLRTVEAAFYALPFGGKLVLQTAVSFPDTSELPESEGLITITSFDGVTDYRTEYSAKIYVGEVLKLRSSIKFEYVDIVATVSNSVIICNGHYTCFGEGINCSTATSNINLIGITGGGASRHPANSSTLEIHSGDW